MCSMKFETGSWRHYSLLRAAHSNLSLVMWWHEKGFRNSQQPSSELAALQLLLQSLTPQLLLSSSTYYQAPDPVPFLTVKNPVAVSVSVNVSAVSISSAFLHTLVFVCYIYISYIIPILLSEALTDTYLCDRSRTSSLWVMNCILASFEKLRKAAIRYVMSVRPPVRPPARRPALKNLVLFGRISMKFYIWLFFRKSVETTQFSLASGNNNGYFTWRRLYGYDDISLIFCFVFVFWRMRNASGKSCR